ncbi:MAG TPA: aminotransferase class I/II-fold pyridoxal phosphate-dependent enzyme [Anaerolineales bacterium]|nr:aminotransferase class I/II-fold pyridoxal phosphate-dependent enzyme [Anaerolineales bacterium]
MDIFEKCFNFTYAKQYIASGYYPYFIPMQGNEGSEAIFQGRRLIMCGSNNYLGLTMHPKVREAAIEAIKCYGTSCTGSRFLNGNLELHEQLEHELAAWVGKQAAIVFSTGMQVNLGTISALVSRNDVVILDRDDHASIVDGARLGWGKVKRFQHNNVEDLQRVLEGVEDKLGKLVVVDGLFSMEGDIAPLPDIARVCKKYGARLMVDDAHALGVLGGGRGTAAHFGLGSEVDLIMGTFSKSLASIGGFIAGDEDVIHYIKHHARALMFSASIPPANAATALAALHVMQEEPERITRINEIGDFMREEYHKLGFKTGNSCSPIIPIFIGDDYRCAVIWKTLFEAGVYVNMVVSPAVPEGKQLLRTSYMATHTDEQLSRVLAIFAQVGKQVGII